jgi:DNA-binding IclR family transcriptional regulator
MAMAKGNPGKAVPDEDGEKSILTEWIPSHPYGKPAGAIHRGLEILELFAVEQSPLTVGEISRKLGFPQSSTSVLLHSLSDLGYLLHDRTARTFFPTVRVTFLGTWLQNRILHHGNLLKLMETLADRSGHLVLLAMQNGLYAQYMHIVSARRSRVGLKPGLLRPVCRAAVGKVLLSLKPDEEIKRIVRNVNARDAALGKPVDANALLQEIEACRRTGFGFSRDGVTAGSSVIATRLPLSVIDAPIAIGVAVHSHEFEGLRDSVMQLLASTLKEYFNDNSQNDDNSQSAGEDWTPMKQWPYAIEPR